MNKRKNAYRLQHELDLIKQDLSDALQTADTAYCATRRAPTVRMVMLLERFYDWARRYEEAK